MSKKPFLRISRLCESITNLLRFAILGFLVPITLSFVVYAGFNSAYTSQGFTLPGFMEQYFNGVYRYRILGRDLLLQTYHLVQGLNLPLLPIANGDAQLYSAYFYINTFFLCLTCATLNFIFQKNRNNTLLEVVLPTFLLCSLVSLGQFVVVPYDTLSNFLLTLSAWLILRQNQNWVNTTILAILVILATLTRESAILILAFFFAVNYTQILVKPVGKKPNREQLVLLILTACFVVTYLTLRFVLGFSQSFFQNMTFIGNRNLLSFLGLLFLLGMTFLLLAGNKLSKTTLLFGLASIPYLLPLMLVAVWWEIRLWMPFLMLLLILALRDKKELPQPGG